MTRDKITIVYQGTIRTFNQLAEGESAAEFAGRAVADMHPCAGPVADVCHGYRRVHHLYTADELYGHYTFGDKPWKDDGVIEGHPTVLVENGHFTGGLQDSHVEEAIRRLKWEKP
jgi:hypothetical protein